MQNWHDQNTDAVVRLQDVASQPDEGFKSQEVPLRKQKGRLAKQATKNVRIPKYRLQYLERIERSKDHLHGSDFEADKNLSVKNAMAKVVALENRNFGYLDYALGQDTLYSVQDIGILMETYRQQK